MAASDEYTTLRLENSRLAEYLEGVSDSQQLAPICTEELLEFQRWVSAWGGKLEVSQVLGIGVRAELRLRKHGWKTDSPQTSLTQPIKESFT